MRPRTYPWPLEGTQPGKPPHYQGLYKYNNEVHPGAAYIRAINLPHAHILEYNPHLLLEICDITLRDTFTKYTTFEQDNKLWPK